MIQTCWLLMIPFSVAAAQPVRVRHQFTFHLDVPYAEASPLFGALAEMKWDADWKPSFVYPMPAADVEGAVFTVSHANRTAIWTTTIFDLAGGRGRVQYLYVIPSVMVTKIDIWLTRNTDVRVVYERTALQESAAEEVRRMGERDAGQGPVWKRAIEALVVPSHPR